MSSEMGPEMGPESTIGELAARFGLATHVLRHWEDMGLLSPARRAAGRRVYGPEHTIRQSCPDFQSMVLARALNPR